MQGPSVFERHPRLTLAGFWLAFLLAFGVLANAALGKFTGMGHPVLFYANPSYGYRMLPNQETWRFGGAHFKINNLGLRAREDWDSGTRDKILFVGDSVTYGGNRIANEALFSELATQGLPGFHSGNAGVPNWGVENYCNLVVKEKFRPASVYVTTLTEEAFYLGLSQGHNRPWIKYQQPAFAMQEMAEFFWHKYVKDTAELNRREREAEPEDLRRARAAAKLKEMDDTLKAAGYVHVVFLSPTHAQVIGIRPVDQRVSAELEKRGIAPIRLLDNPRVRAASREEKDSWYQDNYHLTKKGHAVWAAMMREALLPVLSERGLVPPPG